MLMKFWMKFSLWALAFVPWIVDSSVFFPFISGKSLLIRAGVALAAVLFAVNLFLSENFRNEIGNKIRKIYKSPLFLSVSAFIFFVILSAIFALEKYRAVFGDVERAEGLVGILFFFGFFLLSLLVFEKNDWMIFFKLSFIPVIVLFAKALIQSGNLATDRPNSFVGNPAFLAGYFLFGFLSSLIVFYNAKKQLDGGKRMWQWFSAIVAIVSITGIFITQTRGTIFGLVAGVFILALYGSIKGRETIVFKKFNLQKLSAAFLALMIVFSILFLSTGSSAFWQKIPGVKRIAQLDFKNLKNDPTIQTRLISIGVSLNAISPENNGIKRFLFGWGPENFSIAYNKNYNPKYYQYEHTWFDRAHNKLLDVVVMYGVLGFLAYLALWVSFFWTVFRKKTFSFELVALGFFGAAYLVHLIFVFDQISTYIPYFGSMAFLVFLSVFENGAKEQNQNNKKEFRVTNNALIYIVSFLLAVFFAVGLIWWTLYPYFQMKSYLELTQRKNVYEIEKNIDSILFPYTYAQQDIRTNFLQLISNNYTGGSEEKIERLFDKAIAAFEDLAKREPYNPRHFLVLGQAYDKKGKITSDPNFFAKAELFYRKAFQLVPKRQDVGYALGLNLAFQSKFDESTKLLKEVLEYNPDVPESHFYFGLVLYVSGEKKYNEAFDYISLVFDKLPLEENKGWMFGIFSDLSKYFYKTRDAERLIKTLEMVKKIKPEDSEIVNKAIDLVKKGEWHLIVP